MRYRYFVDFRHGISVFAKFSCGITVLGTPQCPRLRAGSQWVEVHEGPVLSAAVSQLVATSSYYYNTTIALSQKYDF